MNYLGKNRRRRVTSAALGGCAATLLQATV
jgi:hypothetical protein